MQRATHKTYSTGENRGNGEGILFGLLLFKSGPDDSCEADVRLAGADARPGGAHHTSVGPFEPSVAAHRLPVGADDRRVGLHGLPVCLHARPVGAHEPLVGPNGTSVGARERPENTNQTTV